MTKILLLSDTHSYIDDNILKYVKTVDEVWHAGDIGDISVVESIQKLKPLRAVYGNIDNHDIRLSHPEIQVFEIEQMKVFIIHIGGYPGRYTPQVYSLLQKEKPDIFISGHSHILKVMPDKKLNLLHMNPGAIGKSGFHQVRTMLRFAIDAGEIKDLELIEWSR